MRLDFGNSWDWGSGRDPRLSPLWLRHPAFLGAVFFSLLPHQDWKTTHVGDFHLLEQSFRRSDFGWGREGEGDSPNALDTHG
jgi:hypothetical protein